MEMEREDLIEGRIAEAIRDKSYEHGLNLSGS